LRCDRELCALSFVGVKRRTSPFRVGMVTSQYGASPLVVLNGFAFLAGDFLA